MAGKEKRQVVCCECASLSQPVRLVRGVLVIEFFFAVLFGIPGVFFLALGLLAPFIWCQSTRVVPNDSPRGREIVAKYHGRRGETKPEQVSEPPVIRTGPEKKRGP